jgi:hypothetical protein
VQPLHVVRTDVPASHPDARRPVHLMSGDQAPSLPLSRTIATAWTGAPINTGARANQEPGVHESSAPLANSFAKGRTEMLASSAKDRRL